MSSFFCSATFSTSPTPIKKHHSELMPAEKNGSGSPVFGRSLIDTPMFTKDWKAIRDATPTQISRPLISGALEAVLMHMKTSTTMSAMIMRHPTKPSSSPAIVKIKSV